MKTETRLSEIVISELSVDTLRKILIEREAEAFDRGFGLGLETGKAINQNGGDNNGA